MLSEKEGRIFNYHKETICSDLFFLSKAISDDETRYFMNFAYCEDNQIIATDGKRLHIIPNKIKMKEKHFLYVIKSTKTKFIGFEFQDDITFPNYKKVLPDKENMSKILSRSYSGINHLLYDINTECKSIVNISYIRDVLLMDGMIETFIEKESDGNKAILFECGNQKAIIMPMVKE